MARIDRPTFYPCPCHCGVWVGHFFGSGWEKLPLSSCVVTPAAIKLAYNEIEWPSIRKFF
jgi:hypothetical protein